MRSVRCNELGGPDQLTVEDVEAPVAAAGQVVLEVRAASVNFPDLLTIRGLYQIKAEPPFTPGFEAAGVVTQVGEGVTRLKSGDRVAAFGTVGAFAEQWAVDAGACVRLPDDVPFATGSTMLVAYGTSYHALKQRAELHEGETILVLGAAGGVGSAAVEIGAAMGARVIAAAGSDEKLDFCRSIGATDTINYKTGDLRGELKELTDGRGVDVVYDPIGGDMSELAFRSLAWEGRHLVIGFAAGDIPSLPLNLPLLKGASLVGVFWGAFTQHQPAENRRNVAELFDMVSAGTLAPRITGRFALDDFRDAYRMIEERTVMGKVVLEPAPSS